MMLVPKKNRMERGTVFDDVYRTIVQKLSSQMIPLINEIFHTQYPMDSEETQLRNEHLEIHKKLITDSLLKVQGTTYHIECQSTPDGQMAIRMFEYGAAIALDDLRHGESEGRPYHIRFPFAAVIYLRSTENTPNELTTVIDFPDGQHLTYHVPIIKVQDYSLEEIFKKRLLLFLPFYILRYEKEFAIIEQDDHRLACLLAEYQQLAAKLNRYLLEENQTTLYGDFSKLIVRVSDYVLQNYQRTKKGVDDTMGGKVLELYSEKLLRRGEARGKAQGEAQGEARGKIEILKSLVTKGIISISVAAKELGVSDEAFKKMAAL